MKIKSQKLMPMTKYFPISKEVVELVPLVLADSHWITDLEPHSSLDSFLVLGLAVVPLIQDSTLSTLALPALASRLILVIPMVDVVAFPFHQEDVLQASPHGRPSSR